MSILCRFVSASLGLTDANHETLWQAIRTADSALELTFLCYAWLARTRRILRAPENVAAEVPVLLKNHRQLRALMSIQRAQRVDQEQNEMIRMDHSVTASSYDKGQSSHAAAAWRQDGALAESEVHLNRQKLLLLCSLYSGLPEAVRYDACRT